MTTVTTCSPILEDLGVSSKKIELTTALYEKHKPRVRLALQVHVRERSSDLVVSRSLVRGVSSLVLRSLVSARLRRVASRWRGTAAHGRDIHEPRSRPPTQHRPFRRAPPPFRRVSTALRYVLPRARRRSLVARRATRLPRLDMSDRPTTADSETKLSAARTNDTPASALYTSSFWWRRKGGAVGRWDGGTVVRWDGGRARGL